MKFFEYLLNNFPLQKISKLFFCFSRIFDFHCVPRLLFLSEDHLIVEDKLRNETSLVRVSEVVAVLLKSDYLFRHLYTGFGIG